MKIIDLEAHFQTRDYQKYLFSRKEPPRLELNGNIRKTWYSDSYSTTQIVKDDDPLFDLGDGRIKAMDAAGIDMQVLSLTMPHIQCLEPSEGVVWARRINDELAAAVKKYPDRFIGLASVPPQSPAEAADELERSVRKLGLRGVCIQSHARNEYLDDKKYWVIFERAEKLDVPIYLHPGIPSTAILKPYADYGAVMTHYGFGADVSLHSLRLIHSGLFDKYPKLKIILGHMGEGLPYWLSRLDTVWRRGYKPTIARKPSEYLKTNFTITTSGFFFQPALVCAMLAIGVDKIAFAVDYPMADNQDALEFMKEAPICDADKEKIYHLNAERMFRL